MRTVELNARNGTLSDVRIQPARGVIRFGCAGRRRFAQQLVYSDSKRNRAEMTMRGLSLYRQVQEAAGGSGVRLCGDWHRVRFVAIPPKPTPSLSNPNAAHGKRFRQTRCQMDSNPSNHPGLGDFAMRAVRRTHLIAAILGMSLAVPAHLAAQDSRRVREERLREERLREQRLSESRVREERLDRMREERLRADRYRDDLTHHRDMNELARERVEAALHRTHESLERAELSRLRAEEFSRLGVDVQERIREALRDVEVRSFDREHALRSNQEAREHALRMSQEARERVRDVDVGSRVREALERAEAFRERNHERAVEEARRNSARLRGRHWY
jgi:hypothetical protein